MLLRHWLPLVGLLAGCSARPAVSHQAGPSAGRPATSASAAEPTRPVQLVEASAFSAQPPGSSAPEPKRALAPDIIQQRVRANFRDFQRCYEDGLRRNPTLEGRVVLRFVIDRDGTISFLEASRDTTMPDPEVTRCILAAFRFVVFPRPDGSIVTVVYPLAFSPGN